MALNKYAADYNLEAYVDEWGRSKTRRVYRGVYYAFLQPPEVIRRLRRTLLLAAGAVLVLLIPLLLDNTRLSRTVYIVLPAALALIPLYQLLTAAWYIGRREAVFTRQRRDQLRRIGAACIWPPVLLSTACVGTWVRGLQEGEWLTAVCLHLALAAALALLPQRKKIATRPV